MTIIEEEPTFCNDDLVDLEGLEDPDAGASPESQFQQDAFSPEAQDQIVATLIHNPDLIEVVRGTFSHKYFSDRGNAYLVSFLLNYTEKYGVAPKKQILLEETSQKFKDNKALGFYLGKIHTFFDYCSDLYPKDYLKDKLIKFAQANLFRDSYKAFLDGIANGGDFFELNRQHNEKVEKLKSLSMGETASEALDAIEYFDLADECVGTELIEGRLFSGKTFLFSGPKKIGKSTLFHSMIPALLTGSNWHGLTVSPCQVVYLDFENPRDYVKNNLLAHLPRDQWEAVRGDFRAPREMPAALTESWLRNFLDKNCDTARPGVLMVDSAYAAFNNLFGKDKSNWANQAPDVRTCVDPLTKVCREYGWSLILIHHHNKTGGTSGSEQWEASVDFVWDYTPKGNNRHWEMKHGRWSGAKPETLVFCKPDRILQLVGTSAEVLHETKIKENAQKDENGFAQVQRHLPEISMDEEPVAEHAITLKELEALTGWNRTKVYRIVTQMVGLNLVKKAKLSGTGHKDPDHYWICPETLP